MPFPGLVRDRDVIGNDMALEALADHRRRRKIAPDPEFVRRASAQHKTVGQHAALLVEPEPVDGRRFFQLAQVVRELPLQESERVYPLDPQPGRRLPRVE